MTFSLFIPTRRIGLGCAIAFLATFPSTAMGQLNRSAVSVSGSDLNPCTVTAPCRSFGAAIAQTNVGGEVIALDSGGYGPFLVDKAITVQAAPGAYAGITSAAANGIDISAPLTDRVRLRGLTVQGPGTAHTGISYMSAAHLTIEDCAIEDFNVGINAMANGDLVLLRSRLGSTWDAIHVSPPADAPTVTIAHSSITDTGNSAINANPRAKIVVADTIVTGAATGILVAGAAGQEARVEVDSCTLVRNGTAIHAAFNGTLRIADSVVSDNTTGIIVTSGVVETYGDNRIRGNGTDFSGSVSLVSKD